MVIKTPPNRLQELRSLRIKTAVITTVTLLLTAAFAAYAESQSNETQSSFVKASVVTIRLGPDQIGIVKTGERLSTRISFREPIKEVICGDLYDPESGTGSFVIQRIDSDVFVKPVAPKGISNMFVKTGDSRETIYNFSLEIVPPEKAYMVVKVIGAWEDAKGEKNMDRRPAPPVPPVISRVAFLDVTARKTDMNAAEGLYVKLRHDPEILQPPSPAAVSRPRLALAREPIRRVAPDYPEGARITGVVGEVIVEVTIDHKGKVKKARAISGPLLLRSPAVVAAKFWRFTPVDEEEEAAQKIFTIKFNFRRGNDIDSLYYRGGSGAFSGGERRHQ